MMDGRGHREPGDMGRGRELNEKQLESELCTMTWGQQATNRRYHNHRPIASFAADASGRKLAFLSKQKEITCFVILSLTWKVKRLRKHSFIHKQYFEFQEQSSPNPGNLLQGKINPVEEVVPSLIGKHAGENWLNLLLVDVIE